VNKLRYFYGTVLALFTMNVKHTKVGTHVLRDENWKSFKQFELGKISGSDWSFFLCSSYSYCFLV